MGRVRLFICTKTLYHWRSQLSDKPKSIQSSDEKLNIAKLETELKRVTEERDLLKKPQGTLPATPSKVRLHSRTPKRASITTLCRLFMLHRSGFYAWLKKPSGDRALEDKRSDTIQY